MRSGNGGLIIGINVAQFGTRQLLSARRVSPDVGDDLGIDMQALHTRTSMATRREGATLSAP